MIILLLCMFGCTKDDKITNTETVPCSGITVTDKNGAIRSDDFKDWQPRYKNFDAMKMDSVYLLPAYPNPAGRTKVVVNDIEKVGFILDFITPKQAHILITLEDPKNLLYTIWNNDANAGHWKIFFDLFDKPKNILPNGIYRVYFNIRISTNEYITFGDIKIER